MTLHITDHRDGFAAGETNITRYDDDADNALISLDVLVLSAGQLISLTTEQETAWLLMSGKISGSVGSESFKLQRESLFDESSSCLHVSADTAVEIVCDTDTEPFLAVLSMMTMRIFALHQATGSESTISK